MTRQTPVGKSSETQVSTVTGDCIPEHSGTVIGPYKLMEQIGQGGFGLVFVAEQQQPVRRRVAVKLIKPGMDTRDVIARFEAERQALALMDHPNIARVFDAGTTDNGRPYFVMELVRGAPITEYCDQNHLTPIERLELFVSVCQAVQHAHQKGIIHRDIKPSNVLVALQDAKPVAKVIDFGVAKALYQPLTDKTIYTRFAQMIGTPLYMSPEQAQMGGVDIDTRSDIYSLGVLLYELLTGTTPFDRKKLAQAAYDEVIRIIRDEEPPKPSTRLSHSTETLPEIAAQRKTDPARLSKMLCGDLDWITMKALEKDRARRYETASGLAADVLRYLRDEPVEASPPSTVYRLRKLARRHRKFLITTAAFAALLVAAAIISTWFGFAAVRNATRAAAEAENAYRTRLVADLLQKGVRINESGVSLVDEGDLGRVLTELNAIKDKLVSADNELQATELKVLQLQRDLQQRRRNDVDLNSRLKKVARYNVVEHNQLVGKLNANASAINQLLKESERLNDNIGVEHYTANPTIRQSYEKQLAETHRLVDRISERYAALKSDPDVQGALAAWNSAANSSLELRPSPFFLDSVKLLESFKESVIVERIQLRHESKYYATVAINGKPAVLMVDTGASSVVLPYKVAEECGVKPEAATTMIVTVADGSQVKCKQVVLDSVRIGQFTANRVACVVLPPEAKDPSKLLGMSFLSRFNFSIDGTDLVLSKIVREHSATPKTP